MDSNRSMSPMDSSKKEVAISLKRFCDVVQQSDLPLSEAENFVLAKILSRESSSLIRDNGMIDVNALDRIRRGEFLSARIG